MQFLGIDPGTERLGFAIIEKGIGKEVLIESGLISTKIKDKDGKRLLYIQESLEKILTQHKVDVAGVEKIFFSKNITTAIRVAEARGVVLALLAKYGIPIKEYTPTQVKSATVGYGNATKSQVSVMVKTILELKKPLTPDDVADAAAIALTAIANRHMWSE